MKRQTTILDFAAVFALAFTTSAALGQNQTAQGFQLPPGKWTLSHHPYMRPGYESLPVAVTSVRGDATKGLAISVVGLENQSSKPVTAIKLGWFLYRREEPNRILQKGNTPLIYPANLLANDKQHVDLPVVAFADVYKPLVKGGHLTGNFAIDVAVTEVRYADGTIWKGKGMPAKVQVPQTNS